MSETVVIFEDGAFENFYPLSLTRPVFELKCGATALHEKILRSLNAGASEVCYFTRDYLAPAARGRLGKEVNNAEFLKGKDVLLVNGRWLCSRGSVKPGREEGAVSEETGELLYARLNSRLTGDIAGQGFGSLLKHAEKNIPARTVKGETIVSYPWELVANNPEAITDDFLLSGKSGIHSALHPRSCLVGDESRLYTGPGTVIHPNVVIDVEKGPVTVEENSVIYPNTWIQGPCFIGPGTEIYGARVREGTSIGPHCRVGGELEESIIHGFTNKYHDGFLGHSYLGEFINLGANTVNSDVKNDYGTVQVFMKGDFIDTGLMKVGAFIGDHTKTGIGTLFNTGSSVGLLSIILGGDGVLPKFIPSFSWYINRKVTKGFGFGKLIEAAGIQMGRRGKELAPEDVEVLETAYALTKPQRDAIIRRDRRA